MAARKATMKEILGHRVAPGPETRTNTEGRVQASLMIEPELLIWAKQQPGGASDLTRYLFRTIRQLQKIKREESEEVYLYELREFLGRIGLGMGGGPVTPPRITRRKTE